jgi:hypothetical protein
MIRRSKAFSWTTPRVLTVDLKRVHRRGFERKPTELWVWGQLKSGEALIQKKTIP